MLKSRSPLHVIGLAVFASLVIAAGTALALVPSEMNYQGRLTDGSGTPLTGTHEVTFYIYDAEVGGSSIWSETQLDVIAKDGFFSTQLGKINPLTHDVFNSALRYLEVQIESEPPQTPRLPLVTQPYSFRTGTVDGSEGGRISGDVKIGAINPQLPNILAPLHVVGNPIFLEQADVGLDKVVVEANDATLGLYSDLVGDFGSGISLSEVEGALLNNKWGLIRQTGNLSNELWFTFGNTADISANPPALRVTSDGSLALTGSAPTNPLTVEGPGTSVGGLAASPGVVARFLNTVPQGLLPRSAISIDSDNDSYASLYFARDGSPRWELTAVPVSDRFLISQAGNTRLIMDPGTGNTVIGPTNPAGYKLEVKGDLYINGAGKSTGAFSGDSDVVARFKNTTPGQYTAICLDSPAGLGSSYICAVDGVGKAGMWYLNTGRLIIGYDNWAEIRIDEANHNIGMGINPEAAYRLKVGGDLRASNICYTGTIGACSDSRFKTNVTPLSGSLARINSLRPVNYEWRVNEFPDEGFTPDPQIGLIAQEVLEIAPEVVKQRPDGYYVIDYSRLTPLLIGAIKEQQSEISELKDKLTTMLQRLDDVERNLTQ